MTVTHPKPNPTNPNPNATPSLAHVYGDHVDTDVIIPARYLNASSQDHLAQYCMIDIDIEFSKRVKKGDIIVAGHNFGCGSSREHAPLAIKSSGISCVIATSFARIFLRNAINIGLPIIEVDTLGLECENGDRLEINYEGGIIHNHTKSTLVHFGPTAPFVDNIVQAGGLLKYVRGPQYRITALPGDGVGPEIMAVALKILKAASEKFSFSYALQTFDIGGVAIDASGQPLPQDTLEACQRSDAVLLGAVGGPKWDQMPSHLRPEVGLLNLRKSLGLYCNLRPIKTFKNLMHACPLKTVEPYKPIDFMIVRELTGGIYFGERGTQDGPDPYAYDIEMYKTSEIEAIAAAAFDLAQARRGHVTSIDKANVLDSSKLWRKCVTHMAEQTQIPIRHMYVDNCAMQLILDPHQFDVILTNNIFGDILSDEASTLVGSIGLMPSASLGPMR